MISVCGGELSFSSSARNRGSYITDDTSVELYMKNVCRLAYFEHRHVSSLRHLLSVDSTKAFVSASVLDYCKSLIPSCPS